MIAARQRRPNAKIPDFSGRPEFCLISSQNTVGNVWPLSAVFCGKPAGFSR